MATAIRVGADITVQLASDADDLPSDGELRAWIDLALAEAGAGAGAGDRPEITVRIVDEDEGRSLNRRYRNRDKAIIVLSFPAAEAAAFTALGDDEPRPLGDLVLCAPVVAREAAQQHKVPAAHWGHLLVHGTLHLLGYDHQSPPEAREMEALETRILARRGIDNPYREQDSA
jgi:probable rRNA maturation factor